MWVGTGMGREREAGMGLVYRIDPQLPCRGTRPLACPILAMAHTPGPIPVNDSTAESGQTRSRALGTPLASQ